MTSLAPFLPRLRGFPPSFGGFTKLNSDHHASMGFLQLPHDGPVQLDGRTRYTNKTNHIVKHRIRKNHNRGTEEGDHSCCSSRPGSTPDRTEEIDHARPGQSANAPVCLFFLLSPAAGEEPRKGRWRSSKRDGRREGWPGSPRERRRHYSSFSGTTRAWPPTRPGILTGRGVEF